MGEEAEAGWSGAVDRLAEAGKAAEPGSEWVGAKLCEELLLAVVGSAVAVEAPNGGGVEAGMPKGEKNNGAGAVRNAAAAAAEWKGDAEEAPASREGNRAEAWLRALFACCAAECDEAVAGCDGAVGADTCRCLSPPS